MKKRTVDIAVSTDPVKDYQELLEYAKSMQGMADLLHCDIMDGKFVEHTTFDSRFVAKINSQTLIPLDVHLMTVEPLATLEEYLKAGANIVTVHYEAFKNKKDLIAAFKLIRSYHALAGLSFKPNTPISEVKSFLFYVDVVLLMSVEPGISGQQLIESTYERLRQLSEIRFDNKLNFKIEIDGGVNDKNAHLLSELGADILVSGNFVYKAPDREKAIKKLKK